jgi:hypothetical protein
VQAARQGDGSHPTTQHTPKREHGKARATYRFGFLVEPLHDTGLEAVNVLERLPHLCARRRATDGDM